MVKSFFKREAFRSGSPSSTVSGSGLSPGGDRNGRTGATLGGQARIDDAASASRFGGWHCLGTGLTGANQRVAPSWNTKSGVALFRASRPNLPETNRRETNRRVAPVGPSGLAGGTVLGTVLGFPAVPAGDEPAGGPVLIRSGTPNGRVAPFWD